MTDDIRLIHGDCLEVLPTLAGEGIDAVIADPPFGARRPSAWRLADDQFDEVMGNDAVYTEWLGAAVRVLKDGGAAYVFTCWDRLEEWRQAMTEAGLRVRSCIVWDKGIHGLADLETCWAPQHELILFGAKGRHELRGSRPRDIIQANRVPANRLRHPYEKPVSLLKRLIEASTQPGDLILDPFAGSGTTAVACMKTGRRCIAIEKDERYIPIIRRRIAEAETPLFAGIGAER